MKKEELLYDHYKETGRILSRNLTKRNWLFVFLCFIILLISIPDLSIRVKDALINNYVGKADGESINHIIDSCSILTIILHVAFAGLYLYFCSINILCDKYAKYLEELEKDLSIEGNFILDREGGAKNYVYNLYMSRMQSAFTLLFIVLVTAFFLFNSFSISNLEEGEFYLKTIELFFSIVILSISIFIIVIMYKNPKYYASGLQKITGIHVVGEIPLFSDDEKNDAGIVVKGVQGHKGGYNPLADEIFLNVRNQIDRVYKKENCNKGSIILITSNKMNAGKTFVANNLAACIGYSKEKVIVCDMNLRTGKSLCHESNKQKNGLTDYLLGNYGELIKEVVSDCYHLIPSGHIPHRIDEFLRNEELRGLLDDLRNEYKYIILDAPALSVEDAILLRDFADVTLLICSQNVISSNDISRMKDYKREQIFNNPCIVLNRTNLEYSPLKQQYGYPVRIDDGLIG